MNSDIEKLLAAVQGGRLSKGEMQEVGNMLLNSLSDEQSDMLRRVTADPDSIKKFMNSPEVRKILNKK